MQQIVTGIVALLASPTLLGAVLSVAVLGVVPALAHLTGQHTLATEMLGGWAGGLLGLAILSVLAMRWRRRIHTTTVTLERRAQTDPLTRVTNRRGFIQAAEAQLARGPASLLYVDADDFKRVNDTAGHEAGDRVLQALSEVIRRQIRPGDVVGRLGGEEFAVLLVGARSAEAVRVAQRLRRAVKAAPAVPVTVSVGIASTPDSLARLLSRADAAMLDAKRRGRDRLVVAQPTLTPLPRGPEP
jgi:diguanylate cyclase (GGDEF)-like protein